MAKKSEANPGAPGAKATPAPAKASSAPPGKAGGSKKAAPAASAAKGCPGAAGSAADAGEGGPEEGHVPRLRHRYLEEVVPKLKREFGIENAMAVPRLERISLNMGMGEAIQNIKILDDAVDAMAALAGQRPTVTRAQKSIAAFKLRAGMPIGCPRHL